MSTEAGGADAAETAHFELAFSPNVSLVSTVRRFVSDFYAQILADDVAISQLAIATHELLDNAVLYSFDGNTSIRVGVRRADEALLVTIETRNRATGSRVESLRAAIAALDAAQDAQAFYLLAMRRSAKRPDGSGLGLARIHAEADMQLSVRVDGDVVLMRATARYGRAR